MNSGMMTSSAFGKLGLFSLLLVVVIHVAQSAEYDYYGTVTPNFTYVCDDAVINGVKYQIETEDVVMYMVTNVPDNSTMWRTDQQFYGAQFQAKEFANENFQYFCEPNYLDCSAVQNGHTGSSCWCEDEPGGNFTAYFKFPRTDRFSEGAPMRIYWETYTPLVAGAGNMIRVFADGLPPTMNRTYAESLGYCGDDDGNDCGDLKCWVVVVIVIACVAVIGGIIGVYCYKKKKAPHKKSNSVDDLHSQTKGQTNGQTKGQGQEMNGYTNFQMNHEKDQGNGKTEKGLEKTILPPVRGPPPQPHTQTPQTQLTTEEEKTDKHEKKKKKRKQKTEGQRTEESEELKLNTDDETEGSPERRGRQLPSPGRPQLSPKSDDLRV